MPHVLCPYCHVPLSSLELEEAVTDATHCLVCPECDTPFTVQMDSQPTEDPRRAEDERDA